MNKFFNSSDLSVKKKRKEKKISEEEIAKYTISEDELKKELSNKKHVLLIEPKYKRKYIPLGLAKIATFVKRNNGKITFARKYISGNYDCVCVTSLFTYDSAITLETINQIKKNCKNIPIIVGGIYASLMPEHIIKNTGKGLTLFLGCADFLDNTPIDYSIDWQLEEPWNEFSYVFTSRGCPNKCGFCAVPKVEPKMFIVKKWKEHINDSKKYILIFDNNLTSQKHVFDVLHFLQKKNRPVYFENGLDCKHITPEIATELGKLKYVRTGMRIGFDRIKEDEIFQNAINLLISSGVSKSSIMAYVLFNFLDTPKEAEYRMNECLKLGIRPYPQKYTPLNVSDRKHPYVGKYWSYRLAQAFRYFWLMGGLFRKMTFEEYIHTDTKFNLTDEDINLFKK